MVWRMSNSFRICQLSCAPVRDEPSSKSEQVTELLLGEPFEVLGEAPDYFVRIRCALDAYEGWIDIRQSIASTTDYGQNPLTDSALAAP
jgi:gamma-D-glutamyl-L-lysine dipeptidyl-peptidase